LLDVSFTPSAGHMVRPGGGGRKKKNGAVRTKGPRQGEGKRRGFLGEKKKRGYDHRVGGRGGGRLPLRFCPGPKEKGGRKEKGRACLNICSKKLSGRGGKEKEGRKKRGGETAFTSTFANGGGKRGKGKEVTASAERAFRQGQRRGGRRRKKGKRDDFGQYNGVNRKGGEKSDGFLEGGEEKEKSQHKAPPRRKREKERDRKCVPG